MKNWVNIWNRIEHICAKFCVILCTFVHIMNNSIRKKKSTFNTIFLKWITIITAKHIAIKCAKFCGEKLKKKIIQISWSSENEKFITKRSRRCIFLPKISASSTWSNKISKSCTINFDSCINRFQLGKFRSFWIF